MIRRTVRGWPQLLAVGITMLATACARDEGGERQAAETSVPATAAESQYLSSDQMSKATSTLCALAAGQSDPTALLELLRALKLQTDLDLSFALGEIVESATARCPSAADELAGLADAAYAVVGPELAPGTDADQPLTPHAAGD